MPIATGFNLQPLNDGYVLVEFSSAEGETINSQIVTPEVIRNMPTVAALLTVALEKGPQAARDIMDRLNIR